MDQRRAHYDLMVRQGLVSECPRDRYRRMHSPERCRQRLDRWKRHARLHDLVALTIVLLCAGLVRLGMPAVRDYLDEQVARRAVPAEDLEKRTRMAEEAREYTAKLRKELKESQKRIETWQEQERSQKWLAEALVKEAEFLRQHREAEARSRARHEQK